MAKKPIEETVEASTGESRTCKVLGINYTLLNVPRVPEDYPNGGAAGALKRAIEADIAHSFNPKARAALVEAIVGELKAREISFPEIVDDQTEKAYIEMLKRDGVIDDEFIASLGPIEVEYAFGSTRSGVNAFFKKSADGLIAKYNGDINVAASQLQKKLVALDVDHDVEATRDGIALGLKLVQQAASEA